MTDAPIIRPLRDADIESTIALWNACGLTEPWNDPRADIARARASSEATLLVAADVHHRIVGTVMAGNDGHRGWLYYVAVAPELQHTGLGRRLVAAAEEWLKARGVVKLMLMIRPSNTAVRGFYEALGYEEQDRILMSRWLDGRPMTP
ncbi:MAG TPA: GNAT family acetyltransferase [Micropepsaceae bacterium]|nr:GNAT family acetyltransferase [Micropepsaceae bacterium]